MTYRERREQRAERLRGFAATRVSRATATLKADEVYTTDHAFNTQPGHIPIRAKVIAREDRAFASLSKAAEMTGRAAGIEQQLDESIYSDDLDAIERLEQRIVELEAERDRRKGLNAEYRAAHRSELKAMTAYERSQAVPYPTYSLTNLSGNIGRQKKRLEELRVTKAIVAAGGRGNGRIIGSRYAGVCADCGRTIEKGSQIVWYRLTREATHTACPTGEA